MPECFTKNRLHVGTIVKTCLLNHCINCNNGFLNGFNYGVWIQNSFAEFIIFILIIGIKCVLHYKSFTTVLWVLKVFWFKVFQSQDTYPQVCAGCYCAAIAVRRQSSKDIFSVELNSKRNAVHLLVDDRFDFRRYRLAVTGYPVFRQSSSFFVFFFCFPFYRRRIRLLLLRGFREAAAPVRKELWIGKSVRSCRFPGFSSATAPIHTWFYILKF